MTKRPDRNRILVKPANLGHFLSLHLLPHKVKPCLAALEWHAEAAKSDRYPFEPWFNAPIQQLAAVLSRIQEPEGITVRLEVLEYRRVAALTKPKQFFADKAGYSLACQLALHLAKQSDRYLQWRDSSDFRRYLDAVLTAPLADAISRHLPQLVHVDAGPHDDVLRLALMNLHDLFISQIVACSLDAAKGTQRLLQHLLEATRYCLPLCFDRKDPAKFHVLVP